MTAWPTNTEIVPAEEVDKVNVGVNAPLTQTRPKICPRSLQTCGGVRENIGPATSTSRTSHDELFRAGPNKWGSNKWDA